MIRSSHGGAAAHPPPKRGAKAPLPRRAERPEGETRELRPRAAGPRARPAGGLAPKEGLKKAKGPAPSLSSSARVPAGVSTASDEAREVAILIATAAIEKKASGLEVIDVAGRVDYADFLVLMSGRSDRHVTALSAAIEEALRKRNKRALAVEGLPHASWVLMDFGDVVVHVFQDDARAAYDIDGLWMDARRVPVPLSEPREPRV
ncbi:MAG: Iojap protein [Labilithrix sp.]|nr:Iojap protein [Labilithrix sp.]